MKLKKQLALLKRLLDTDLRKERQDRIELHHLLKRMKKKEKRLKVALEHETDPERARRLQQDIDVLHAQRKKGIASLKKAESGSE